jgi:voltage-gated potassium channel
MPTQRLLRGILLLITIITLGTLGYIFLENINPLNAIYMTIITISTVGFKEVSKLSNIGKVFTILLIIAGVGILFYTLGAAVELILEGVLEGKLEERRKKKKISRLKDHIIVCGYGRVGKEIAKELKNRGEKCVVIESSEERFSQCEEDGFISLLGDASSKEVLLKAGIERARGLAAAVDTDADNVFVVLAAREINKNLLIVARANTKEGEERLKHAGANQVISPNIIGGKRLANLLLKPFVCEYIDRLTIYEGGEFELDEAYISPKSKMSGLKINEAGIREKTGALVLAIKKAGEIITNPSPDMILEEGDRLIILGTRDQLEKARKVISGY